MRELGRGRPARRASVVGVAAELPRRLLVRPMTGEDALRLAQWRYRDQWAVYDLASPAGILDELDQYWSVSDVVAGTLVGFACAGASARVPDLDEDPPLVDVGVGMNPDLVGQGRGPHFGEAVLQHLACQYPGLPLRAVVQAWNVRSVRFSQCLGFIDVGEVISSERGEQVRYRVLLKPPPQRCTRGGENLYERSRFE